MRSSRVPRLLFLLVLTAAGAGAYYWWTNRPPPVGTRGLTLYGNVDIREVQLAFNDSEHITRMLVQEGDAVHKGQLLATLDKALLRAAVTQAEAQVAAQAQVVKRLEAGSRPQEIAQARAQLEAAQASAREALLSFRRVRNLEAKKLASPQDLDDARGKADVAAAQVRVAEQTLALAVAGPREEDIENARATLRALQAQLELARRHLADADLYAPADGIIRDRILEPGDFASPDRPVYTLALTEPVWVRVYVSETDLGRIHPGMPAQVTTDSYPGRVYPGWIGYISPTAEFTPKSVETQQLRTSLVYQVRVYVCNSRNELRLGMPATVRVNTEKAGAAGPSAQHGHCGAP